MWGGFQEFLRFLLNYLQLLLVCGLCVFRLHFCLLEMVNMLFWPRWLLKSCHFSACRSFWVALKPGPYYMTFRVSEALGPFTRQDSLVYDKASETGSSHYAILSVRRCDWLRCQFPSKCWQGKNMAASCEPVVLLLGNVLVRSYLL